MGSIPEFLASLDFDQLLCAQELAGELIKKKQQEPRRVVWCVEDDSMMIAGFAEGAYVQAAERLLVQARRESYDPAQGTPATAKYHKLHLVPRLVRESEYDEWLFYQ